MKYVLSTLGVLGVIIVSIGIWIMSTSNTEVKLRRLIEAKQQDNLNELDNMQKKIAQVAQVPPAAMKAIKEIVVGYAEARPSNGGSLATMLHEAVPQAIDTSAFNNLQNIVSSSRDRWTRAQTEILDLKREHDTLRSVFPASLVVGARPEIKVQIVTSTRAQGSMETGRDDDIKLFQ